MHAVVVYIMHSCSGWLVCGVPPEFIKIHVFWYQVLKSDFTKVLKVLKIYWNWNGLGFLVLIYIHTITK